MKRNAANELIKHRFFAYLRGPRQLDEQSVGAAAAALDRFDEYNRRRDFKTFRPEQADAFQNTLLKQRNARTGEPLSKASLVSILRELKRFFFWLAGQPGYKSRLRHDWAEHFNPPRKALELARARREPLVPTLEQIHATIGLMPAATGIERRNRALLAATIVTGGRDDAIASLLIKHVDLAEGLIHFDAREVRTKFSKTFPTWFFPVGGDAEAIFRDWVAYLTHDLGYGPDNALFPSTITGFDSSGRPLVPTLGRECWTTANTIRAIFKEAFKAAGLPYFKPHSFRSTLARLGMEVCQTPAELKAWSQNLGHDDVMTTLTCYGEVPYHRQRDLIRATADRDEDTQQLLDLGRAALAAMRGKKAA